MTLERSLERRLSRRHSGLLAIQIRDGQRAQKESNLLARSTASEKSFDQLTVFRRLLAANPDVARIWLTGCSKEKLEVIDQERFQSTSNRLPLCMRDIIQRMEAFEAPLVTERGIRVLATEIEKWPGLKPYWPEVWD